MGNLGRIDARGWLGGLADAAALGTVVYAAASLFLNKTLDSAILALALALIAIFGVVVAWRLERTLRQKEMDAVQRESVARATPGLSAAAGEISRATSALTSGSESAPTAFVQYCESACKEFARAIHLMTGQACRVTLQEVYIPENGPDDSPAVKTFATSYGVHGNGRVEEGADLVQENTDFRSIFFEFQDVFFCNDLPDAVSSGYRNSHWSESKLAEWRRTDGYPYKSTVVWPLRGVVPDRTGRAPTTWEVVGFLSVDCRQTGTFDRDTITPVGETLAHAVYSGLVMYRLIKEEDLWQV